MLIQMSLTKTARWVVVFCVCLVTYHSCYAQMAEPVEGKESTEKSIELDTQEDTLLIGHVSTTERLLDLQNAIALESRGLKELLKKRRKGIEDSELESEIREAQKELTLLTKSFEQIAIGGISLDVFGLDQQPKDWQEELALVVQPLLENLRSLTNQPRKKENLKRVIEIQENTVLTADRALIAVESIKLEKHERKVLKQLDDVSEKWQRFKQEAQRKKELASLELANLNGKNIHWFDAFKSSLLDFAKDRGLTLLLAVGVATGIALFFRLLTVLIERRRKKKIKIANRTAYRVVAYAQRLLMLILMVIGVLIVFFVRGDVLLLALTSILVFAAMLGLRNLLPQFVEESRLLLNIGAVRENERVVIDGVPWRVASINVFSKLVNPDIRGILRLPLAELKNLKSRPIGNDKWFPSSIGDWVVDDSDKLYEVIEQSPDSVELQSAQGTNKLMPTSSYYSAGFVNLTKSKRIRITSQFGVDYTLQPIALDVVPTKFKDEIQEYLIESNFGTQDIETRVEFQRAGASSLDYLVIVNISSSASAHYYRIERCIQQACVKVCNREGWGIPFPQLTVHQG